MNGREHAQAASPAQLLGHLNSVEAANAPSLLFLRGEANLLRATVRVAMVGSREASQTALVRATKLASALAKQQVTVVSGLARGVDRASHLASMEAGGRTIAVIGTPLDKVYPPEHAELQERIAREHLLVSQFPPGYPTSKSNFPRRNRVMALLSHASVIVEAGDSSGTLSQGWEAIRLGRPLFISKSVARDRSLSWPRQMIGYGAMVLEDLEELLAFLPSVSDGSLAEAAF
jgi:DNA processing protein